LFQCETYGEGASICLHLGFAKNVQLYACTCSECGATTLRPAPEKMEEFRQWYHIEGGVGVILVRGVNWKRLFLHKEDKYGSYCRDHLWLNR
jgi:hypothetical protein